MKKIVSSLLLTVVMVSVANANDPKIEEGINVIGHFEKFWKEKLIRNIKADSRGVKAVKYCSENIYSVTQQISDMYPGIRLKRVSLKNRNPKNRPNKIDIKVLKEFDKIVANRKNPKTKIITTKNTYRVYRPLRVVTPMCLKCHGRESKIHPEVKVILNKKYPEDRAINFRYKQVRGALVAIIDR